MAEHDRVYLVVISEDENIQEKERIKLKGEEGYINLGNVFLCVLLLSSNGYIKEPRPKNISKMLEELKKVKEEEKRRIIYVNFYHSKETAISRLKGYGQVEDDLEIEEEFKFQFHHTHNDEKYTFIKTIIDYAYEKNINKIIELIEKLTSDNLEQANEKKLINLLETLIHKMEKEDFNKSISIIKELLKDDELLKIIGDTVLKEIENSLKNESKKEINCGIELLKFLLKCLKSMEK